MKLESEKCNEEGHHFRPTREYCECGEQPRHTTCKCPTCGAIHWLPRRGTERVGVSGGYRELE